MQVKRRRHLRLKEEITQIAVRMWRLRKPIQILAGILIKFCQMGQKSSETLPS